MKYVIFLRHTEAGVQVGREKEYATRYVEQDPNAQILLYGASDHDARVAVLAAIETLRFTNRLREKQ